MSNSYLEKQDKIKSLFAECKEIESKYNKIMELGRTQLSLDSKFKTTENLVNGCQSTMHLHARFEEGKVFFEASSDALISAGLAYLLIAVYSGESPETILKHPPTYLEELGVTASITPSRANGLYNIHLRMKQDALKYLMTQNL